MFMVCLNRFIKELFLCFQKLVSGELHTLYFGRFPLRESNPGPWSKAPNRQQYMTNNFTKLGMALVIKDNVNNNISLTKCYHKV